VNTAQAGYDAHRHRTPNGAALVSASNYEVAYGDRGAVRSWAPRLFPLRPCGASAL